MKRLTFVSIVCMLGSAAARATTPTPPLALETSFTRGHLTVRAVARQPLTDVRLFVTGPNALLVKAVEPRGREIQTRAIDDDRVEHSLVLTERMEAGTASAVLALSVREAALLPSAEIEIRAIGRTEDGGTAVGHVSRFVSAKNGELTVQSDSPGPPCALVAFSQLALVIGALLLFYAHK